MLTEKKETMGALLVCLAATLWGFDSIVLTPNLFKLSVPYVVFMVHLLPFVGMTLLFGKEELKNIKKLDGKDLTYFFLVALFGGSLGTLSIVKALFLVNFDHLDSSYTTSKTTTCICCNSCLDSFKRKDYKTICFLGYLSFNWRVFSYF